LEKYFALHERCFPSNEGVARGGFKQQVSHGIHLGRN